MSTLIGAAAATPQRVKVTKKALLAAEKGPYRRYAATGFQWSVLLQQLVDRIAVPPPVADPLT